MREFIWNEYHCRVALAKLFLPTDKGGIAVPNMNQYYLASKLQWVAKWMTVLQLSDTATEDPPRVPGRHAPHIPPMCQV